MTINSTTEAFEQLLDMCSANQPLERNAVIGLAVRGLSLSKAAPDATPSLTLAQQHADELVSMLDKARAHFVVLNRTGEAADIAELLAKIDPPQPPTLEEALDLLARIHDHGENGALHSEVAKLLDRAHVKRDNT